MNYEIIDFQDCHQKDFARLNYHWIEKYFTVEEVDRQTLDHPKEKIYDSGGHILLMEHNDEIVGAVALIKKEPGYYELAKMAISEGHQGKGLGYTLGMAALAKAKELGAKTVYLESNSKLAPAIKLYEKMGFKHIEHKPTPYCRCDVQMELRVF